MTPRQGVELFHLIFLRALSARLEDKTRVALKGGANLRFYFGSIRYSEDMDLDVASLSKTTLEKKVSDLLASQLVTAPLRAQGLALVEITKPKQTETTQRWKAGLRDEVTGVTTRTRVEFSRRGTIKDAAFEAVSRSATASYLLPPFLATHYSLRAAIVQKVHALCDRRLPQARDIFDLNHLFARHRGPLPLSEEERAWVKPATERGLSISFDDYVAAVLTFLEPEQAELFASADAWNLMQSNVLDRLAELDP